MVTDDTYHTLALVSPRVNRTNEELIEAGNVRHEHEFKVCRDAKLPAGKILIPGVSHSIDLLEPELVADRIITCAEVVGREKNVIAGTDYGLADRVQPQIALAKLRILRDSGEEIVEVNSRVPVRDE